MQPWDLQCVGTESRLWRQGWPQDPKFPSTLLCCPYLHPTLDPEGRDSVFSIRLCLEEWGKAQNKRVAAQVGGRGLLPSHAGQPGSLCLPRHCFSTLPHPAACPRRLPFLDQVSWAPLFSGFWMCLPNGHQQEILGQER